MDTIKTDKDTLKKFGFTMAVAFGIFAVILFFKGKSYLLLGALSLFFATFGLFVPAMLKFLYIFWMKIAFLLGWINTRIILAVLFYVVFSPAGLIMRLLKIDILGKRFDKKRESYWEKADSKNRLPGGYERQF